VEALEELHLLDRQGLVVAALATATVKKVVACVLVASLPVKAVAAIAAVLAEAGTVPGHVVGAPAQELLGAKGLAVVLAQMNAIRALA
jgi:hypothetical protein